MILWLASYPRSGNTFCRAVLDRVFDQTTLGDGDYDPDPSVTRSSPAWDSRVEAAIGLRPPPAERTLQDLAQSESVFVLKTHSRERPWNAPAIYLVRDGRDAMISYAYFAIAMVHQIPRAEITPDLVHTTLYNLLMDPSPDYGRWSDNVNTWTARDNTAVIRFEQLIVNPLETLERAFQQLGVNLQRRDAAVPTFDALRTAVPEFFRFGRQDNWKSEFPPALLPLFWQVNGDTMQRLGYHEARQAAS